MTARHPAVALMFTALLLAACGQAGQVIDAGAAPTRPPGEGTPAPSPEPTAPAGTTTPPAGDDSGDGTELTTVTVYFTRAERVEAVTRVVPRVPRIGSAALEQLLAGPTAGELAAGYTTQIPDGTRLRGLSITERVAVVDLSGDFESGGDTHRVTLRLAQVTCTLDAFPTVDGVRFAIDGERVDVLSGDGVVVDEAVACSDYARVSGTGRDDASAPSS